MRIISGKYRGKKLTPPDERSEIRPTTDRAKEGLFNCLYGRIGGDTVFLDLFCGSGANGVEALSRGVKKVYFVDAGDEAFALTKKNLVGIDGDYEIIKSDFKKALKRLSDMNVRFDVIFVDPPYAKEFGSSVLAEIRKNKLLAEDGIVVIERSRELAAPSAEGFIPYDTRRYALSAFDFFRAEKVAAVTGSFDPITVGHLYLIDKALSLFDKVFVVLLINETKTYRYSLAERVDFVKRSVSDKKVIVDSYDGYTFDYCLKKGIQYIVRGVRNDADSAYEKEMAEYNFAHGGIKTVFITAKDENVSSTLVRDLLDSGESVDLYVSEAIASLLKKR